MAIKSGQILNIGDGFLIDRLQSGGVSSLNIPEERIYELGNYYSLTTIRDTADLSFDLESLETSMKTEAILLGVAPSSITTGDFISFTSAVPLNVISPFRSAQNQYNTINGVIIPHLFLESVQYRFGLKANAMQTFTLRGDSVFYVPGNPYEDVFTSDGVTASHTLSHTALEFFNTTLGVAQYVVNCSVYNPDGTFYRAFNGSNFDYTDTSTTFTFNTGSIPVNGATIRVQYGSTAAESFPQSDNSADGISVAPAAIRSKDIDVYIGSTAATPVFSRWNGVQSVDLTWKVNLDADQELGNPLDVSQDYVTPDVTGTISVKNVSVAELFRKIQQASNVPSNQVAGTLSSTPVPLEIHLNNPDTGARLKTIFVPDARFEVPAINTRVNQKLVTPFKFFSDSGQLYVYNGTPSGWMPEGSQVGTFGPFTNP
jgi:hypothetical protein